MSMGNHSGQRTTTALITLSYPSHVFNPEDLLTFVELDEFVDDWLALGLSVEDDLWALQIAIMSGPTDGDVIAGTGGLRKMRFAPLRSGRGKSGGIRVCYVYLPEHFIVLLVFAYAKASKVTLSAEEKSGIKQYIEIITKQLDEKKFD